MNLKSGFVSLIAFLLIHPCLFAQASATPQWLETTTNKLREGAVAPAEVLQLRARLMQQAMINEPDRVRELMLHRNERQRLLQRMPGAAEWIESEGRWDGEIYSIAVDDFDNHSARLEQFLSTRDRRFRLSSSPPLAPLSCSRKASVAGFRIGAYILATEIIQSGPEVSVCASTGEQNTAVILVSMPSVPLPSNVTKAFLQEAFFGENGRSVANFYSEASYGKTWLSGSVFGPFELDSDYPCSDVESLVNAAIQAADAFIDFQGYNRVIVVSPRSESCAIGRGTIGCTSLSTSGDGSFTASWVFLGADYLTNSDAVVSVAGHEMGHSLGLMHANTRDYGSLPLGEVGVSGVDVEYADIYDLMGFSYRVNGQFILGHFNAQHKTQLGWLTIDSDYLDIESSGTYVLSPYSAAGGVKAVRVRRGIGINEWLWLEYRQPVGLFDSTLSLYSPAVYGGALVHHESPSNYAGETYLLDFAPDGTPNDFQDAPLPSGEGWDDPYTDLSLQTSVSDNNLEITVTYRPGGCTYLLQPSSMTIPAIGGRFWFDVVTGAQCNFQATTSDSFVVLDPESGGTGGKRVYFSVLPNGITERSAAINAGGSILSLTQEPMMASSGLPDFNGDGKPDVLWRNISTGQNYIWYLDGVAVLGGGSLPLVADQSWKVAGVGDFNSDGKPDVLWRNISSGENYVWYLNGETVLGGGVLPTVADQSWKIVGVSDFNKDSKVDILWRNVSTGDNYVWYLNGVSVVTGGNLPMVADQNWKVAGVADFNSDGKPDVLWRYIPTGDNYVWYLDGVSVVTGGSLPMVADQNWKIAGIADFNSDGKVDVLWRNLSTGENYVWYLDGVTVLGGDVLPMVTDQNWTIVPQIN